MAVRSREELMTSVRGIIGDREDADVLSFLEDMTDTFGDLETRVGEDWKTKYEENDAEWRRKYRDRFFGDGDTEYVRGEGEKTETIVDSPEDRIEEDGPDTYEELFAPVENKEG